LSKKERKKDPGIDYGPIPEAAMGSGGATVASAFGILLLNYIQYNIQE